MHCAAKPVIFLLMLSAAAAATAHAGSHDGNWSVLVITEKGDCDAAYRYAINVADGQVKYAGDAAVNMAGTVAPDGAVRVSIRLRDKGANGSGHLGGNSGAGTWHGFGPNANCAGRCVLTAAEGGLWRCAAEPGP